jgi:hypothetical protein
VAAEQQRQQTNAWSPGQKILNSTGSRVPEHTLNQPVPIVARIVWAEDGEGVCRDCGRRLEWADRVRAATGPAVSAYLGVAGRGRPLG